MEWLNLIGIVIVIVGFARKWNSILVILLAAGATGLVSGISPVALLETIGTTFVANRNMAIFILVMLVTGTLERTGLREAAAGVIGKFKGATSGMVIGIYGVMRAIFAAFNVGFGGVAGFVRPVIMPMAEGAITSKGHKPHEEHMEELKGMASGMENITWFFGQVLFVGGSGALLVQGTLQGLGIHVELIDLALVEIPVCVIATALAIVYYYFKDRRMLKKYYKDELGEEGLR